MSHQDWKPIVISSKQNTSKNMEQKQKQNPPHTKEFINLDNDNPQAPQKINLKTSVAIQKARNNKKMSQKHLANLLNVHQTVISEYENGKVIPTKTMIRRLEKVLESKLM